MEGSDSVITAVCPLLFHLEGSCLLVCSLTLGQGQGFLFHTPPTYNDLGIQDCCLQLSASYEVNKLFTFHTLSLESKIFLLFSLFLSL